MATLHQVVATNRGLCSVCVHGTDCLYAKDGGQMVLNCEQFDQYPPMTPPPPSRDQVELEKLWNKPAVEESGKEFKGLCSNCDDRHVCIYPKPVGGVWHCDEYR